LTPRAAPDSGSDHGVIDAPASTGPPARVSASADINRDGELDLVTAGTGSTVGVFLRTPDASKKK
jgi:hypothetical protein